MPNVGTGALSSVKRYGGLYLVRNVGDVPANFLGQGNQIPSIQVISSGLADSTAALFWLSAHDSITKTDEPYGERLWPVGHTISANEPVILNNLNINWAPLIVGLLLSTLMAVLVGVLFQSKEPAVIGIQDAGILQTAWLFARSPEGPMILADVDVPLEQDLRSAGDEIMWKGAADGWDKEGP